MVKCSQCNRPFEYKCTTNFYYCKDCVATTFSTTYSFCFTKNLDKEIVKPKTKDNNLLYKREIKNDQRKIPDDK